MLVLLALCPMWASGMSQPRVAAQKVVVRAPEGASRRAAMRLGSGAVAAVGGAVAYRPLPALAEDSVTTPDRPIAVNGPTFTFTDPLFELTFPKDFFKIRRTISGDITRRGGVIFTAGRLSTAEIVTIERFSVAELLTQAGATQFFPDGTLSRWEDLGTPAALGTFICERRDNEATAAAKGQSQKGRASRVIEGTFSIAGSALEVEILTNIGGTEYRSGEGLDKGMTPGVRRVQKARLYLLPGGKEIMGVWAGCLDDFWYRGEGDVLRSVVASFKPLA